jgi:hypothetical protein
VPEGSFVASWIRHFWSGLRNSLQVGARKYRMIPLPEFKLAEDSFKTRDAHANQMRDKQTKDLATDIDVNESYGMEHGFEVIRNALFQQRTNPYLIREFMLAADLREHTLDPGYRLVF